MLCVLFILLEQNTMNNLIMDRETYCRFCAKHKHADKMYNLKIDTEKYAKVYNQLVFMNIDFVDLSEPNLPKTVCLVCYEAFNDAYQFLFNLKHAQNALDLMFSPTKIDTVTIDIQPEVHQAFEGIKNEKDTIQSLNSDSEDEEPEPVPYFQYKAIEDIQLVPFSKEEQSIIPSNPPSIKPSSSIDFSTDHHSDVESCTKALYSNNFGLHFLLQSGPKRAPTKPEVNEQKTNEKVQVNMKLDNKTRPKRGPLKYKTTSWAEYTWKCQHCGDEFPTYGSMRGHSKQIHNKCYAYYCIDCPDLEFDNAQRFATHVRKHFRFLGKVCFFCDEQHKELYIHEYKAHKQTNFCHLCGENFSSSENLQLHIDTYSSGKAIKKSFSFTRKRGAPVTIDQLTCKVCSKVFSTTYQLDKHKEIHREDRQRNSICETCGKTFYDKGYLKYHVNTVHYSSRDHICKICQSSFASIKCLRNHVRNAHVTYKPIACETCGKTFKHNSELTMHKVIHSDTKPYVCRFCSKSFRAKYGLKNHENIHTGAKTYSCDSCEKVFNNWGNYNKHMIRRHGVRISKIKRTPQGSYPIDPNTGDIICANDAASEEWKNQLLTQVKRPGKRIIEEVNATTVDAPTHFNSMATTSTTDVVLIDPNTGDLICANDAASGKKIVDEDNTTTIDAPTHFNSMATASTTDVVLSEEEQEQE